MAATLAAAIFGSGRDLVCSPVSSPRVSCVVRGDLLTGRTCSEGWPQIDPPGRHVCGDCLGPRPRGWTTW